MKDIVKEMGRKTFHQLSLVFLGFYHFLGYPRIIRWMIPWSIFALVVETGRLYWKPLNDFLFGLLGALARGTEKTHYSGIVYTTAGSFLLFLVFTDKTPYVSAGLLSLALGDAVAALVGKWIGKHHLYGSKKTVEGSAACFLTCAAVGAGCGFSAGSALAGASAATVIEFLPTTVFINDNMWMPIGVALTLRLCAG